MVVCDFLGLECRISSHLNSRVFGINGNDFGMSKSRVGTRCPNWSADVLGFQSAGRYLSQHRSKQEVITLADQGDFQVRIASEGFLQSLSYAYTTESAP